MCKHILNAQVSVRAPCCRRFFDCPICHSEQTSGDHKLRKTIEMQFICKKCKRAFRKDLTRFEEEDEYCPHCDNHFVIEAKTAGIDPSSSSQHMQQEGEEEESTIQEPLRPDIEHSARILLDDRMRYDPRKDWVAMDLSSGEQGERIDEGGLIGVFQQKEDSERRAIQATKEYKNMLNAAGVNNTTSGTAGQSTFDDDDLDWS